jgi:anti-sigma regulatory factor (Ser/Thr protein kinase)
MEATEPLTYSGLDGLAFAAERDLLPGPSGNHQFLVEGLGPFLEYLLLARAGLLSRPEQTPWLQLGATASLYRALSSHRHLWICPKTRRAGVYRTYARRPGDQTSWIQFCLAAQHAANSEGFVRAVAAQLVGAIGEMESNIYEHSEKPATGIIAFKATAGVFEFVVADCGIGVLRSLRTWVEYAELTDHGEALRLALTDGVSRFGRRSGRGYGFRPLFTGLANLNGMLRFRSGDHALTINGQNFGEIPMRLAKKTNMEGFLASVSCRC